MNTKLIEKGTALILEGLVGPEWQADANYQDTPSRVAAFYKEMFQTREYETTAFKEDQKQMVVLAHHIDYTMCPHHLLPVRLDISLAYLPNGSVLGLSKLVRLVKNHFEEPILQESLTDSIADELMRHPHPKPHGAGVLIYGEHACMQVRGVKTSSHVVTSAMRGAFLDKPEVREEFLRLVSK